MPVEQHDRERNCTGADTVRRLRELTAAARRVMLAGRMSSAARHADAIRRSIAEAARMPDALLAQADALAAIAELLIQRLGGGGRLLTCGNGGSAAEALHMAEELVGRFSARRRSLGAVCLSADPTALTCIANDFGYEEVFARQIDGLGRRDDVLVALSTSGRSPSIVRALQRAKSAGLTTVGLLGPRGSEAQPACDHALTFDGLSPARTQEAHLLAIHLLLERIDAAFVEP